MRLAAGFSMLAMLVACADFDADWPGSDNPDPGGEEPNPEPDPDPDPTPGPDYTGAYWRLTNVSTTLATISHDPQIAFVGGSPVVAFSEPESDDFGDQSIHVATTDGLLWTDSLIADGRGDQLAYPSLSATEGAAHLVYSGVGDDDDRDIWIAGRAAGVWSEPINMTGDPAEARQNERPQVVTGAAGPTALYFSRLGAPGTVAEEVEIRAQQMGGEAEVIYTADRSLCFDLRAIADAAGNIHAITDCGGFRYMTNAGGSWSAIEIPLGASGAPSLADISIDPAGGVHLAWSGRTDCPELGEGETCARVFYSRDLGVPVVISRAPEAVGYHPVIAADDRGRPLIAYHHNTDGSSRVYVSHSDDGITFAPPRALGDGANREWMPGRLMFGPDRRPHLMFERMIEGSDPLDVDIIWATTQD